MNLEEILLSRGKMTCCLQKGLKKAERGWSEVFYCFFFKSELEHAVSSYTFNSVRASKESYP